MAKFDIVNVLGKKVKKLELSDKVFGINPHNQSMFDLVLSERASLRQGTHSTKTRDQVSGGGRKPWKQKGTGRARQGSIRSPQWRGGGIVFGPTPNKNYELKVNKKVKKLAFKSGYSKLANENKLVFIDNMEFKNPSTKDFLTMLKNLKVQDKKVFLVLKDIEENLKIFLSARNLSNVLISTDSNIMLDDLLNSDVVIMNEEIAKTIERRLI